MVILQNRFYSLASVNLPVTWLCCPRNVVAIIDYGCSTFHGWIVVFVKLHCRITTGFGQLGMWCILLGYSHYQTIGFVVVVGSFRLWWMGQWCLWWIGLSIEEKEGMRWVVREVMVDLVEGEVRCWCGSCFRCKD